MKNELNRDGLAFNEPLLWERSRKGRVGLSLPRRDVETAEIGDDLVGDATNFPELSEVDVARHYTRLSQWNFCIDTNMYPLGSCTMKYNPKTHERQAALHGFAAAHPLLPTRLSQGLLRMMAELETFLAEITGMEAVTLQPAAGAHGELCGMLMFHAYHRKNGNPRSKIIVPDTAHGTNPASAALCNYRPIKVSSGENGILAPEEIARVMDEDTAGIMITNPNTLGLFEENIREISDIVHQKGGLVYGDGANLNAVMGIVDPAASGLDVLHLNLHKTFATPHGGGGPGSGPVCVKKHLAPYLPVPRIIRKGDAYDIGENFPDSIGRLHSFYGNVGVMIRAYCYIAGMGADNLKKASQLAVLNANYLKESLKDTFELPYDRPCMHECVFSDRKQHAHKITTLDMVKRLMDFGFHPPTIYFPLIVGGAMMVEPTETESRENLDRFIATLKAIAAEAEGNPEILRKAPHGCRLRRLDETAAARKPCLTG